jgi:hypothetical protein
VKAEPDRIIWSWKGNEVGVVSPPSSSAHTHQTFFIAEAIERRAAMRIELRVDRNGQTIFRSKLAPGSVATR